MRGKRGMSEPYRIIMSSESAADLKSLHAYISLDSPDSAAKMVERILTAIESLKLFPHRTVAQHTSRGLRQAVRSVPVPPYIVYFRVLDDERVVRILTVRHGARRRPRRFLR